jgi:hypothetical protein
LDEKKKKRGEMGWDAIEQRKWQKCQFSWAGMSSVSQNQLIM